MKLVSLCAATLLLFSAGSVAGQTPDPGASAAAPDTPSIAKQFGARADAYLQRLQHLDDWLVVGADDDGVYLARMAEGKSNVVARRFWLRREWYEPQTFDNLPTQSAVSLIEPACNRNEYRTDKMVLYALADMEGDSTTQKIEPKWLTATADSPMYTALDLPCGPPQAEEDATSDAPKQ